MAPQGQVDDPLTKCLSPNVRFEGFKHPKIFSRTIWTLGPIFSAFAFRRFLKERRPGLLYVRANLLSWLLHWYARRLGIPSVAEHNGIIAVELSHKGLGRLLAPLAKWFQRLSCTFASHSRAVTEGMKLQLMELGADGDKIFVLGNGTDVENSKRQPRSESLSRLSLPENRFYVGFLGSLSWWQGVHTLVEAVHAASVQIPELHLLVGGEGSEREALEAQAKKLGISDRVTFLGYVDHDTRLTVLSAMDIATLPACAQRNKEQGVSPLKVRDYAAVNSVILAANLPGLEQMAEATALVFHQPDDADDLARKIIDLYGDTERMRELARNSRIYAEKKYSWHLIGKELMALLQQHT